MVTFFSLKIRPFFQHMTEYSAISLPDREHQYNQEVKGNSLKTIFNEEGDNGITIRQGLNAQITQIFGRPGYQNAIRIIF